MEGWDTKSSWISRDFSFPLAYPGTKAWTGGEIDDGGRNSGSWPVRDLPCALCPMDLGTNHA